jgi:hypothetical protein
MLKYHQKLCAVITNQQKQFKTSKHCAVITILLNETGGWVVACYHPTGSKQEQTGIGL